MPKYGLISRIGQGAQGVLVKARVIETGATVAIKRIHLKPDVRCQIDVLREICCLKNCNHENIVKLHDSFFDDNTASIVMEFVDSNFKLVIMDSKRPQNDFLLNYYFSQIFSAVAYLHGINIMHRDLKPENILVSTNNRIKLGDFGLACLYVPNSRKTYSHQVFTRWYRAPELLFGSVTYDPKVDVWACGCILAEYINGSPLFMGFNDIDQIVKVFSILGTPNEETWPGWSSLPDANKILFENTCPNSNWSQIVPTASLPIQQLIQELIRLNPSSRLSAEKGLQRLEEIKSCSEISYKPPLTSSKYSEISFNRDLDIEGIQSDFSEFLM